MPPVLGAFYLVEAIDVVARNAVCRVGNARREIYKQNIRAVRFRHQQPCGNPAVVLEVTHRIANADPQ
jgi:hypothetical protein